MINESKCVYAYCYVDRKVATVSKHFWGNERKWIVKSIIHVFVEKRYILLMVKCHNFGKERNLCNSVSRLQDVRILKTYDSLNSLWTVSIDLIRSYFLFCKLPVRFLRHLAYGMIWQQMYALFESKLKIKNLKRWVQYGKNK